MPAIQTKEIKADRDGDFLLLLDALNGLMAHHGFPLVRHKGSASWLAGPRFPGQEAMTYFKLLFQGPGAPAVFGVRREFAQSVSKLATLQWPIEFAVMPKTDVAFVGFRVPVANVDLAKQRVEKILGALPEPDPALAIPLEDGDDSGFDEQLKGL